MRNEAIKLGVTHDGQDREPLVMASLSCLSVTAEMWEAVAYQRTLLIVTYMEGENKVLLYKAILKPIWTYGIELWGCAKPFQHQNTANRSNQKPYEV
jgi:hypothetical protein